jgi:transcriptional regulator with XRE-family HTH domain
MQDHDERKAVGRRISAIRSERGLSQEELAKLSGVSREQISRYESGQTMPSAVNGVRLAKALDCPLDVLYALVSITD